MILRKLIGWLTGGALDRILDTVDRKVQSETDREKIKGDIIQEHYKQRGQFMRYGGFWLMFMFAAPLAVWFSAVIIDSIPYLRDMFGDQQVHALPPPLDDWAGGIIVSIFGVVGVSRFRR